MNEGLKIVVDWDTADAIMEAQLLYTTQSMTQDIKRLKAKKKLKEWEKEDLEHFERVLEAIKFVGSWYVFDFDKKVKKYVKQQL